MKLWIVLPGSVLLILLGIALEIALGISQDRQGAFAQRLRVFLPDIGRRVQCARKERLLFCFDTVPYGE